MKKERMHNVSQQKEDLVISINYNVWGNMCNEFIAFYK